MGDVVARRQVALGALTAAAWYAAIVYAVYYPPAWVLWVTGAGNEGGHVYGFHSGFGGTILFGAMLLAPGWYFAHSCKHHWSCLRPGRYKLAGGAAGAVCKVHHPTPPGAGESHQAWQHRLHMEWLAHGRGP